MSFIKEFKAFIMRGNIIELAVAVIIGAAFGDIVASLVDDIITPLLLTPALKAAGAKEIATLTWGSVKYGSFLSAILKFTIIAVVLFTLLKTMNRLLKREENNSTEPSTTDKLLEEIRDLLKK